MAQETTLQDFDRDAYFRDPTRKQRYVNTVFDIVASSYDQFTRRCSFGMDQSWKRHLVRLVSSHLKPTDRILDLACGTGDLAFALSPFVPQGHVTGSDICEPMVRLAEKAREERHVDNLEFQVCDMMATGFPDESLDVVTTGYGLRNCPNYRHALVEMHRILKPGGWMASLEFVRPANPLWRFVFVKALLTSCKFYGWLWHREPDSYGYLAHSISYAPSNTELCKAINDAGFELVCQKTKLLGAIYVHVARKK